MHKDGSESGRRGEAQAVPVALRSALMMIASGEATSRAAIARHTGLARSAVGQHVDTLIARGIVEEIEESQSVRGRPPRRLAISPRGGVIAVADVDVSATQVALAHLNGDLVASAVVPVAVDTGPENLLNAVTARLRGMLTDAAVDASHVRHVVIGLPAPVDFARGAAVRPPIMPGWDDFPVRGHLGSIFACPVTVDNDVNLMALGAAASDTQATPLLFVKVGYGIGAGIVTAEGTVHRGADGAAGDIGHIRVSDRRGVLCRCGKTDCLEAVASYRVVLADLDITETATDNPLHAARELARRIAVSDAQTLYRIRQAASDVGEVVAGLIHTINPRTLVLGGPLCEPQEMLAGVRAAVYEQALPLATRRLTITTSQPDSSTGIHGAVALAMQEIFSPAGLGRLLAATP